MVAWRILLPLLVYGAVSAAAAATIRVGPGGDVARFADAVRVAQDGDTIEVQPGDYRGDVAVLMQRRLTIRGVGERPVFHAAGRSAEGKAIWVIRNGDIRIENIEFRGSRVPDGNGAGLRFEHGRLHLVRCAFFDNEMGLLTANFEDAELAIEHSEFGLAPTHPGSLHHLLYVGRIGRFELTGSRLYQGWYGHLVKSRARVSRIVGNELVDGPLGQASYEIDLPNGGLAEVLGNRIGQSAGTQNRTMVSFGAEGQAWSDSRLVLRGNVFVNDAPSAFGELVQVWWSRLPADARLEAADNRLTGRGSLPR